MTTKAILGTKTRRVRVAAAIVAVAIGAVLLLATLGTGEAGKISAAAFHDEMRKTWEDHATWTRLVIVSLVADLPDAGPTLDRLMRNQADIGDAIKPFYGETAGDHLTGLLRDHIAIAGEIVLAAQAGDQTRVDDAVARWYANADAIAGFLANANPRHWPADEMRSMMHRHLDLTLQEAVAQLTGDYEGSIEAYDLVHVQILEMADMLSAGIIHQFPNRFTGVGGIHG